MTSSMQIHETEIDGIPTFWAPMAGPVTCALMFRVGSSDETLPESGISHLVEHLAMHELHDRRFQMNAFVDIRRTVFHCRGRIDEVESFLNGICESLRALPSARVEHERVVLHAESGNRALSVADSLASIRFGPRGLGKAAYKELGLLWLDADHVNAWARRYFTRDNAVLWISGEPPAGLNLELPEGARMVQPAVETANLQLPGWYQGLPGVVGLSVLGKRSVRMVAATAVLDRRVKERIRHELALSYAPGASYTPISNDTAFIVAAADGKEENLPAMTEGLVAILDDLVQNGPTQREIDDHVTDMERGLDEPTAILPLLDRRATAELTGDEYLDPDAERERLHRLDPAEVGEAFAAASRSTLLSLPPGVEPPSGYNKLADFSDVTVQGKAFKAKRIAGERQPAGRTLYVGDEGVSVVYPEGPVTVLFERCSAMLHYTDGGRALIDDEGFRLHIAPNEWSGSDEVIRAIDAAVPKELQVPAPQDSETPSAAIMTPAPAPSKQRMSPGFRKKAWWIWLIVSLAFLTAGFMDPEPTPSEVPPGAVVQRTASGLVDCGSGNAFSVVRSGANPEVLGDPKGGVKRACDDQAMGLVVFSVAGLLSTAGAVAVGVRARKRRASSP